MSQPTTHTHLDCYHCGEPVEGAPLRRDDHDFCCLGCATVYELLRDNDLGQYYALDQRAGRRRETEAEYAFLDDEALAARLLDFTDGQVAKITLFVPNIHCSSCIWLLENLPKLHPAVAQARVNFLRKEAAITFLPNQISLRQLAQLMATLGYAPQITLEQLDRPAERKPATNRRLLYQMGVAFFCFGNLMLLSFPEYLTIAAYIEQNFREFFGYLNILLALPVVLYCSTDYFKAAAQAFRQRQMNIEVPIALGIVALFGVSLYEILSQTGAGYLDSLGGLLFFLLSGRWFQQKTYEALSFERDYKSYFPIAVTVKQPEGETLKQVGELQVGDRILVRHQELVPADARLLKSPASGPALIDYSFVTGEARPVEIQPGELIYAGGRQTGGTLELEVTKPFSQSYLTQLWNNEVFHKPATALTRLTNRFSRTFTTNVLVVSTGAALYWLPQNLEIALRAFTSVLIIACPCAIALAAPFALGTALRYFGRRQCYLKNPEVLEHLAAVDTIVFDKTGTLTDPHQAEVSYAGQPLTPEQTAAVEALAAQSAHPLSKALSQHLRQPAHLDRALAQALTEGCPLPPNLEQVSETPGQGLRAQWQGAELRLGSRAWVGTSAPAAREPAATGSTVHLAWGGQYLGCYTVRNRYRPGLPGVVAALAPHYKMMVLSGDDAREETRLAELFSVGGAKLPVPLHFNQTPQGKLDSLQALAQHGHRTLMLGDGLNDAGALKQSQVGLAVADDVLAFSPASDGILDGAALVHLPRFMRLAKAAVRTIKVCFAVSLCYNVVGLSFAVRGALSPVVSAILMPLSSITVVLVATLTVRWAARRIFKGA